MIEDVSSYVTDNRVQTGVLTFFVTLVGAKLLLDFVRKEKIPPGPTGVPLLGYLPFFGDKPFLTFLKLREKYGDIFSIKMGTLPAVVINGKDLIKEAFVTRGDDFSGRPQFYSNQIVGGGNTLSFGVFDHRTIFHKKLAMNALHSFANARKNPIEDIVEYEAKVAVTEFAKTNGKPFYPRDILMVSVGSVIYQLCYGKQSNIREDDSDFKEFILRSNEFVKFVSTGNTVDVVPWLRYIMPWKVTKFVELIRTFISIRNAKLEENMKTFNPNHLRHIADSMIALAKEQEAEPNPTLTTDRIHSTLDDITGAGFETVSTTMNWTILLMTAYPDVQKKAHAEIDEVLGKRPPRLQDKPNMNYCMATIHEIMRFSNIVPLAIPHSSTKDTELNGYFIPKDTIIIPNMYSISHDKELWGDPMNFRPERFLDKNGEFDKSVAERFNIFSMGRRKCLGEFLARMELFLFFTGILQHCTFSKPDHVENYSLESEFGLTRSPVRYETCATIRN